MRSTIQFALPLFSFRVDNDDGSSFYDISENIFFDADGFKMDYVSFAGVALSAPSDGKTSPPVLP